MNNTQNPSPRQHLPASTNNSMQDYPSLSCNRYRKRHQLQNTDNQNLPPSRPSVGHPSPHHPVIGDTRYEPVRELERPDTLEIDISNDRRVSSPSSLHGAPLFYVPSYQVTPSGSMVIPEQIRLHPSRTRWHYDATIFDASFDISELLGLAIIIPKPRDLVDIESLHSYQFSKESHQSDQTSCVVCMCEFAESQLLRVLPCFHEYHAECIDKWFMSHTTCPICRGNAKNCFTTSD